MECRAYHENAALRWWGPGYCSVQPAVGSPSAHRVVAVRHGVQRKTALAPAMLQCTDRTAAEQGLGCSSGDSVVTSKHGSNATFNGASFAAQF